MLLFLKNLVKTNSKVKLSKNTFGIELEVFYFLKKNVLESKSKITEKILGVILMVWDLVLNSLDTDKEKRCVLSWRFDC